MMTDAADHGAATANDSNNNTGKEAPPDREQHTADTKETAVMMTPEEMEGWKTYISKKAARRSKKMKEREDKKKQKGKEDKTGAEPEQTTPVKMSNTSDLLQSKEKEERQEEEEKKGEEKKQKKTKTEERKAVKNQRTNDDDESAEKETENPNYPGCTDEETNTEKNNIHNQEEQQRVDREKDIEYATESDLFDSDSDSDDKTLDASETMAMKESKFYLSIRPRNNNNFDPREIFVAFLQTIQEVDPEAYICPFDKHNQSPILEKASDIPNTSKAFQYIYSMRERRGTWSSVVRVQSEMDDWKLLSAPQMRVFLLHTGVRAVKQELDSPNLANAGWILGLHPRSTSRKDLLNRIKTGIPHKSRVPMEVRGHALYMPRGVGNQEDPNRRLRTEALQIYCDVRHVTDLQEALATAVNSKKNTGEMFIPHAGRLDTHSNKDLQSWVQKQNNLVNKAARHPLRFPMMNGNLDDKYVIQGGMTSTARDWFMAQKEFGPRTGILQIETEHIKGQGATLVYDKNLRSVARANMEMMITRYQKVLTDTSREILFDSRYKYTASGNKLITELVKDARDYQRAKRDRAQRREAYKRDKEKQANAKWATRNEGTQPKISAHYDKRETTKQMSYTAAVMGRMTARKEVPQVTQEVEEGEITEYPTPGNQERSPPTKRSRTEEMMNELNSRMDAMESTAEKAKAQVEGLESIVQQSLSRTIELTKRVQDLSRTVGDIPNGVAKSVNNAIRQAEKDQNDRIELLEQRENQAAREMAILGEKMTRLQAELQQAKSETEEARQMSKRTEQQQQKQDKMPKTTEIRHQGRQIAQLYDRIKGLSRSLIETKEEIKTRPTETMMEDVAEYSADIVIQSMQQLLDALDGDDGQFRNAAQRLDPNGQDEELRNSNTPVKKARALGSIFETKIKDSLLERCREMGRRMREEHPIYKDILAVRKAYKQLGQAQEQGECLELGNGDPSPPSKIERDEDIVTGDENEEEEREAILLTTIKRDGSFAIEDHIDEMAEALSQLLEDDSNSDESTPTHQKFLPLREIQNESGVEEEDTKTIRQPKTGKQTDKCLAYQNVPTNTRPKPRSSKRIEQKKTAAKAKAKTTPKYTIQNKDSVLKSTKKSSEAGGRHGE